MPAIEDVSAVTKKVPDQPRKRAPGLKRDPPSRGGDGIKNIFEEYKTKDNRKSDAALLKDQYLRDDAVDTFKSSIRRKGHDFEKWLNEQSGDDLSALGTYYSYYAHQVFMKKNDHFKAEQKLPLNDAESKAAEQELFRLGKRLETGRSVVGVADETPRKSAAGQR